MIPHYMYLLIVRSHGNPLYTELVRVPKFLWIICLTRFFDYFLSWLTLFYSQWWWFDGFFPYFHPQQSLWCSYGSYGIEQTVRTLICLAPSLVNALKFCFFTKKKKNSISTWISKLALHKIFILHTNYLITVKFIHEVLV